MKITLLAYSNASDSSAGGMKNNAAGILQYLKNAVGILQYLQNVDGILRQIQTLLAHFGDNGITAINIMQTNIKGPCNDEI